MAESISYQYMQFLLTMMLQSAAAYLRGRRLLPSLTDMKPPATTVQKGLRALETSRGRLGSVQAVRMVLIPLISMVPPPPPTFLGWLKLLLSLVAPRLSQKHNPLSCGLT